MSGVSVFLANMGPMSPVPNFGHLPRWVIVCWGISLSLTFGATASTPEL
jgi:hypothetical protein